METERLKRIKFSLTQKGALYSKTETLIASGLSKALLLPTSQLFAIGVQIPDADDLKVEATMGTQAQIEADTAQWDEWDGASLFNPAVTAVRFTNNSATLTGAYTLTVKGAI